MTHCVIAFLDGVGRAHRVLLHRVVPNAYGGGGSPPLFSLPQLRKYARVQIWNLRINSHTTVVLSVICNYHD
jgi:hypothetical protein